MLALALMFAITFYTKRFQPRYILLLSVLLSLFAGYTTEKTTFLVWLRVVNYYPFFFLGYCLDAEKLLAFCEKRIVKLISAVFLVSSFIFVYLNINMLSKVTLLLSGQKAYSKLKIYADAGALLRLLNHVAAFAFIIALISLTPKIHMFFTKLGQRTLAIYASHYCFLYTLYGPLSLKAKTQEIFPSLWPAILLLEGVALTFFCANKYFHNFTMFLLNTVLKPQEDTFPTPSNISDRS